MADLHDDGADSDGERHGLVRNPEKVRKVTSRRKRDDLAVEKFLLENRGKLSKRHLPAAKADGESTIAGPHKPKIIHSAREYQIELFERAKARNTIIVLPTGTYATGARAVWC